MVLGQIAPSTKCGAWKIRCCDDDMEDSMPEHQLKSKVWAKAVGYLLAGRDLVGPNQSNCPKTSFGYIAAQ